jgi:hypothetical protein
MTDKDQLNSIVNTNGAGNVSRDAINKSIKADDQKGVKNARSRDGSEKP